MKLYSIETGRWTGTAWADVKDETGKITYAKFFAETKEEAKQAAEFYIAALRLRDAAH